MVVKTKGPFTPFALVCTRQCYIAQGKDKAICFVPYGVSSLQCLAVMCAEKKAPHAVSFFILNKKESAYLISSTYQILVFYYLPWKHKDQGHLKGQPIVSSKNPLIARLGE